MNHVKINITYNCFLFYNLKGSLQEAEYLSTHALTTYFGNEMIGGRNED
jgi:hypothetical protein